MADFGYTTSSLTLEELCQSAVTLQSAADPLWDIVNETLGGTPQHRDAAEHAARITGAVEPLAGRAAAIPAGTRCEVIAKAKLVLRLSHSAEDAKGELATSLAQDVLRLLAQ